MELKKKSISVDELMQLDKESVSQSSTPPSQGGEKTEKPAKTAHDKYYLPVLNLNWNQEWQSKPVDERKHWTDEEAMKTCLGNCCGVEGLKGACCHLDPYDLEHVLGPIDSAKNETWIKDTVRWFRNKGIPFTRQDLVIDYEEGKIIGDTLFRESNNNNIFQQPTAYPMLRFQVIGPRYACKFMNPQSYKCTIYEVRPNMCRTYYCQYIQTNYFVKAKPHPNRWQKMR